MEDFTPAPLDVLADHVVVTGRGNDGSLTLRVPAHCAATRLDLLEYEPATPATLEEAA